MKRKISKAQVKTKAGIQIIIGSGRITLINLRRAANQYIKLSPDRGGLWGWWKKRGLRKGWGSHE